MGCDPGTFETLGAPYFSRGNLGLPIGAEQPHNVYVHNYIHILQTHHSTHETKCAIKYLMLTVTWPASRLQLFDKIS